MVSYISYPDAVWSTLSNPSPNLCHQYISVRFESSGNQSTCLAASTVLHQFMAVMRIEEDVLKSAKDQKHAGNNKKEVEQPSMPDCMRLMNPISHYQAIEGDSYDQMDLPGKGINENLLNSC